MGVVRDPQAGSELGQSRKALNTGLPPQIAVRFCPSAANHQSDCRREEAAEFDHILDTRWIEAGMHGRQGDHVGAELLRRFRDLSRRKLWSEEADAPTLVRGDDPSQ